MFTPMQTPKTRAEFERAFNFALEQMRNGKITLPMDSDDYIYSLRSVRMLPNGRLDFLSVDEHARLHANMTLNMMTGALQPRFAEDLEPSISTDISLNELANSAGHEKREEFSDKDVGGKRNDKKKTSSKKDAQSVSKKGGSRGKRKKK